MGSSKQLDKARAAVKKKNYEYAAELYNLHLKMNPGDVDARKECRTAERAMKKLSGGGGFMAKAKAKKLEIQAGAIRVNKKDPEKTMIQSEELLKQDPDNVTALLRLGEAASYANQNEVAVITFEDALGIDKQNKEALRLLGRVQEGTGNLEKALKCYQRLNKIDPKDKEALDKVKRIPAAIASRGYEEGSKKGYKGLIDQDEAKKLEARSQRVRTPEQALERIEDLKLKLQDDPKDTKTLREIAELYVKAELPDKAIETCNHALKVEPGNYLISELRGDLMLTKYTDALKKLKAAYGKNRDPAIKQKYGKLQKEHRTFEIEEYKRRAEAHPTEPGLNFPLGKALYDAGQIDAAIAALQKAKADSRKRSQTCYYLGQCFIKKKILNMALKELNTAREDIFEMDELKKDITYLIGRIYEGAKKKDKARTEYEKIAEVDFNYKDVTQRIEALSDEL
jgi:tetratricopeptide (TPR) repeat protein